MIATIIQETIDRWGMDPIDINDGWCDKFADEIVEQLDGAELAHNIDAVDNEHVHFWVAYRDKCYDAECLDGVTDYHDLPFFQLGRC